MASEYAYDPVSARYRVISGAGKGQFIGSEAVKSLTIKAIDQAKNDLKSLAQKAVAGSINVAEWERVTALALKQLHGQQYILGRGGLKQMAQSDYGRIGAELKKQYRLLRGVSEDLILGSMTQAEFLARMNLYSAASTVSFERGRAQANKGFAYVSRSTRSGESCPECKSYAALGRVPNGDLPLPTQDCTCQVNCRCTISYHASIDGDKGNHSGISKILTEDPRTTMETNLGMIRDAVPAPMDAQIPLSGAVTPEDLILINRYVPKGMDPLTADEVRKIVTAASDNLLTRSLGKFQPAGLEWFAKNIPGLPAIHDHEYETSNTWGRVFQAWHLSSPTCPLEIMDRAGNLEYNRQIVEQEGFHRLYCAIYYQAGSIDDSFRYGRLQEVSIGGFRVRDYLCPLCVGPDGNNLSFRDTKCPHYMPDYWYGVTDSMTAPFFIRYQPYDLMEISQVVTPNIPNAGVLVTGR